MVSDTVKEVKISVTWLESFSYIFILSTKCILQEYLPNLFIHNNTHSMLCDIEHSACFTMVIFEWHTLLHSSIAL